MIVCGCRKERRVPLPVEHWSMGVSPSGRWNSLRLRLRVQATWSVEAVGRIHPQYTIARNRQFERSHCPHRGNGQVTYKYKVSSFFRSFVDVYISSQLDYLLVTARCSSRPILLLLNTIQITVLPQVFLYPGTQSFHQ